MAFIVAGIVLIGTLGFAVLQVFAAGMASSGNAKSGAGYTLAVGLPIATLIAASHWLKIGW